MELLIIDSSYIYEHAFSWRLADDMRVSVSYIGNYLLKVQILVNVNKDWILKALTRHDD